VSKSPFQWSVFGVDLDPVLGSEQAGRRPVLVVSRETANASLPVVTVLPIARRKRGRRIYPNETLLPKGTAGLVHHSIAMAHQLRTLSKERLGKHFGHVDDPEIRASVRTAIRTHLDLD
jgi:mRNA interferase MazF